LFSLRRTVLIGSRDILHFCSFTYRQHDNGVFIAGKQEGGGGTVSIPAVTIIDAEMGQPTWRLRPAATRATRSWKRLNRGIGKFS